MVWVSAGRSAAGMAEKALLLVAIGDVAELVGHAPLGDHGARQLVACSMSDEAPEVTFSWPKTSSSATRPPIAMAISDLYLVQRHR